METSLMKTMLDDIALFGLLCSSNNDKCELVQRYCLEVDELFQYLKSACREIVSSEVPSKEEIVKLLEELDATVDEAKELIGSWKPTMSKIYFVLQIESIVRRFCKLTLIFGGVVGALLPSPEDSSFAKYMEKIQHMNHEHMSIAIQEAVRNYIQRNITRPDHLDQISNFFSLSSNEELLMEAVALEKLKVKIGHGESHILEENIDDIIKLVAYMHDTFVQVHQLHSVNGVAIPADFCCPLSLHLMFDPVIVASGQTYERAFIRKWLDQGFDVCPKTRQTLGHANLIPNYTVKALISNWCESNNIKLPDPMKSISLSHSAFVDQTDRSANDHMDTHFDHSPRVNHPRSPEDDMKITTSQQGLSSSSGAHLEADILETIVLQSLSLSGASSSSMVDEIEAHNTSSLVETSDGRIESSIGECNHNASARTFKQLMGEFQSSEVNGQFHGENHTGTASGSLASNNYLTDYRSHASGEVAQDAPASSFFHEQSEFPSRLSDAHPTEVIWRRPSIPQIIPSQSTGSRPDSSDTEIQVRKLVEDLKTDSIDLQREATTELRMLSRSNMENRMIIANNGAISLLVGLLHSADFMIQENAVTALLNLSINDDNKTAIANANAIDPLIFVLETGTAEAKENSAATLFSISVIDENKVKIGRSGAIRPLVDLLGNGTPRGKKDAATALFNLSIFHENKARTVQAGAVEHLVELMDPAAGMVDKAVAVLANLATISEGRTAIGHAGGIPRLVEVVELGSARGKENAAAALLQLCTNSSRFCSQVLREGAVPPLVALSQSGTPRAKEKAQSLLSYFRNQRHDHSGRA